MTDTSAVTTPATDSSTIVLADYHSVVRSGLRMLFELDHDLVDRQANMDVAVLALAGIATALATGLGAVPVFLLGERASQLRPFLWGTTVGLMGVASVVGLLLPALDEDGGATVAVGLLVGVLFLLGSRGLLAGRDVHVGKLAGAGVRRSLLVFGVLFVHSLPEGFAIGTAFASNTDGLALFIFLAIALQNVPEGTSVAIPMESAGFGRGQQFWAAVLTSAPQPVGAVGAYLAVEQIHGLLPFSFAFAAGAMLALVFVELAPEAYAAGGRIAAIAGTVTGAMLMLLLAAVLGVQSVRERWDSSPRPPGHTERPGFVLDTPPAPSA